MIDASVFSGDPLNHSVNRLTDHLAECRRILIRGGMGTGKSTLALDLSLRLSGPAGGCQILELDPGRPPFGVPGAVSRGWWIGDRLEWADPQALCSLNAARFRLPLIQAARRLMGIVERLDNGPVIVDPPGVVRGVGGAELLVALAGSLAIDAVVVCQPENTPPPLEAEVSSLGVDLIGISASPQASRPSSRERAEQRTALWDAYLANPKILRHYPQK